MKLEEAGEYAKKWAAAHKGNSRGICMAPWLATVTFDDRIIELEDQRDKLLEICRVAEKTAMEIHSGRRREGSMPCGILADKLNRIIGEIDKKEKAVIGG